MSCSWGQEILGGCRVKRLSRGWNFSNAYDVTIQFTFMCSQSTCNKRDPQSLQVWEIPAIQNPTKDKHDGGVLYLPADHEKDDTTDAVCVWRPRTRNYRNEASFHRGSLQDVSDDLIVHFLPAKYPTSVAPGYLRFASFCFVASIAGSAAMVLSTQTLLLAVGVVGSNVKHASIMAGALNWVLKDGIGQLGGVLFASQMGKTRTFDADPKRWRMVAAIALDCSTLLEILSPLAHSSMVLPIASIANVGKNIGFLTASASRAALHQSLAITGNLGDVTAKSASQSIVASLVGTSVGIGLSSLLSHDVHNFVLGFGVLTLIHQGCNYASLKFVPLVSFNRHRLHLLLEQFLTTGMVLTPSDVAQREIYFPFLVSADDSHSWLAIGSPLEVSFPTPSHFFEALRCDFADLPYILHVHENHTIHLLFFRDANGEDMIRGMLHAYKVRKLLLEHETQDQNATPISDLKDHVRRGLSWVEERFPSLLDELHQKGWKTGTEFTTIETAKARRLSIECQQD